MKKTTLAAGMAVVIAGALLAAPALAQTKPVEGWQPPREELDPARRVPAAPAAQGDAPDAVRSDVGVQPGTAVAAAPREAQGGSRGGAFIGVKGGKGWVFEDVDQSALEINAGYRWQAGAVTLVGIEVAGGRLDATTEDGFRFDEVDYASIGANARFNFGAASPVFALVRAGYMSADSGGGSVDGGYFGVGLGVDVNRHFNVSLTYTNYVYFNEAYWDGGTFYYDADRADTVMFGLEARF